MSVSTTFNASQFSVAMEAFVNGIAVCPLFKFAAAANTVKITAAADTAADGGAEEDGGDGGGDSGDGGDKYARKVCTLSNPCHRVPAWPGPQPHSTNGWPSSYT